MYTTAEMQQTYKILKVVLSDEETFHHVVVEIFESIDISKDGGLDKNEIINFIKQICVSMGLAKMPENKVFDEVFRALDEDSSGDIDMLELKDFLKKIFITQRDEIARLLGY